MANTSYYLYQRYIKYPSNDDWVPVYPMEFSVSGDSEDQMPMVMKMDEDPACGGDSPTPIFPIYQWVNIPISEEYECSGGNKYYVEIYQVSYDNGRTWQNVEPEQRKRGSVYEYQSEDCGYPPQTRTLTTATTCIGYDKYTLEEYQVSYDSGATWETTGTSATTLIQADSPDCGYVPPTPTYRWYQLLISEDSICSAGTKYYVDIYQVSYDNGITWQDVTPRQTRRGVVYEYNSPDCIEYRWTEIPITSGYICDDCEEAQYRWTATTGYVCSGTNKMTREIEEVSYDSGATWIPTGDERAALPLIEADSPDCGYVPPTPQYRTLTTATTCINYDKYVLEEYQVSYDSGVTWTTTGTSATTLIEADSPDCGYIPPSPYETQYFTTIPNNNGKFKLNNTSSYYSTDSGATWTLLYGNTDTPTFTAGQKIMWKSFSRAQLDYKVFSSTTSFVAEGNVMSLLYGDNFVGQYDLGNNTRIFARLFQDTTVSNVDNLILPATTLSDYCYEYMFSGCYMLRSAPILSATTLAQYCYQNMFQDCNNLQSAPVLPATTLAENCYRGMFIGCTSLTTSPVLSVTTLVKNCYRFMFSGCTSLNTVVCIATDISASGCIGYWLSDVAASGTFFKDANTTWPTGTSGIPTGWTVQNYNS